MTSKVVVEEIAEIDRRSFEMASQAAQQPDIRSELAPEARQLADQLAELSKTLKRSDPPVHAAVKMQVSEATLDLLFVQTGTPVYSLRLGRLCRPAPQR